MANTFSNNYQFDASDNYLAQQVDGSASHARMRKKLMTRNTGGAAALNDTLVLGTFRSSDRLFDLRLSTGLATPTTGAINVGLYKAALDHVPVAANLIDANLLGSAVAITTELDRTDLFVEQDLEDWNRGTSLWGLANLGDGSYTEDPQEDWDLVATFSTALDAAQIIVVEADFVSFG